MFPRVLDETQRSKVFLYGWGDCAPRGILAMSGDVFGGHNWDGATGI